MNFQWTDGEVREALSLRPSQPDADTVFSGICTDSRKVELGHLFLALSGDRFDGNDFVPDALARGAVGAVVSREFGSQPGALFYHVPDTLLALGALAHHRREALGARVVGITGSSGKTSTKDLLRDTLEGSFRVHSTQGNLNNRIGLPLTLLATPSDAEVVVLEMGTNEPGEIRALTEIAEAQIGIITTVSETHLEKLGSLDGVLEEKLDLLRGLPPDGRAVVGDDPPILEEKARGLVENLSVTGWSDRAKPEYRPEDPSMTAGGCYRFRWMGEPVKLRVPGRHSVQNALLALAVADVLEVPPRDAARRVSEVEAGGMRSEIRALGSLTLLVDCYNANPQSVRAALELLVTLDTEGPRVAVLGSMLELGENSRALHRQTLEDAMAFPLDLILATGLFAEASEAVSEPAGGPRLLVVPELDQAQEILLRSLTGTEAVLLKASRGVAMEALIPGLEHRFGPGKAA